MSGPRVVGIIGGDKGGDLYHFLKCLPTVRRAFTIEIRGTPYIDLFRGAFPGVDMLGIPASSYAPETVDQVRVWLADEPIDVLFIDGDKSRFHDDFLAYLPMVRAGGLVLMHDVRDAAPGAAFERARLHVRVRESATIEDVSEVAPALERERAGIPPANAHEGWLRAWRGESCGVGVLWV